MLELISNVFQAVGTAQPPARNAVAGFWNLPIPGKQYIAQLLSYASNGGYVLDAMGLKGFVTPKSADDDRNVLALKLDVWPNQTCRQGEPFEVALPVPYPNQAVQNLCQRRPAQFGNLEVTLGPGNLLPSFRTPRDGQPGQVNLILSSSASCRWIVKSGWFKGIRQRAANLATFRIGGIAITPDSGELLCEGLRGNLLPKLRWI